MQENINIPDSTITTNLSFRQLVLIHMQQLTNFPYIEKDFDALTDYELLCLVVKFLNDVIANQNEQNASITRMYNSFLALQDYVNNTKDELEDAFNNLDNYVRNYFDNLDVQEEINNKLDQMLKDGVLEQIIEQFIQSTALWCFDTVADMKAATNLIDGSFAKTLGYYAVNDGGVSTYKIRTKTNVDTPDDMFIIEMNDNTLVAVLICTDTVYPEQLGAKHDGETDDSLVFETAINNNKIVKGNINNTYLVDSLTLTANNVNIKDCNFFIQSYDTSEADTPSAKNVITLNNQKLTLENCYFNSVQDQVPFENLRVTPSTTVGLSSNITVVGSSNSSIININNCTFDKMSVASVLNSTISVNNSTINDGEMGIYGDGSDVSIDNCIFNMSTLQNFNDDGYYHTLYLPTLTNLKMNNSIINAKGRKGDELHLRKTSGSYTGNYFGYIYGSKIYTDTEQGCGQVYNCTLKIYDTTLVATRIAGISQIGQVELHDCNIIIAESSQSNPVVFNNGMKIQNCKIYKAGTKRLTENNVTFENCEFSFKDTSSIVLGYQASIDYTKNLIFKNCIFNFPNGTTNFNATYYQMIYDGCIFKGTNLAPAQAVTHCIKMLNCVFTESNPTLTSTGEWQYLVYTCDSTNHTYVKQTNFS